MCGALPVHNIFSRLCAVATAEHPVVQVVLTLSSDGYHALTHVSECRKYTADRAPFACRQSHGT